MLSSHLRYGSFTTVTRVSRHIAGRQDPVWVVSCLRLALAQNNRTFLGRSNLAQHFVEKLLSSLHGAPSLFMDQHSMSRPADGLRQRPMWVGLARVLVSKLRQGTPVALYTFIALIGAIL